MSKRRKEQSKGLILKNEVFTKDGFVSALNTMEWLRIPVGSDQDFDIAVRAKMKAFLRRIAPHKKEFNDLRLELAKEYGTLNSKTKNYDFPDPENEKKFNDKIDELRPIEFEIKHEAFKIDEDTETQFAIIELLSLEEYEVIKQ